MEQRTVPTSAFVNLEANDNSELKPSKVPGPFPDSDIEESALSAADSWKNNANSNEPNKTDVDLQIPSTSFPQKLMDILSSDEHSSIVGWLPNGTGFVIHKRKDFVEHVLPLYFKATKFTSFTRKLSRWGFARETKGINRGAYFNKMFQRGKPDLCKQMTSHGGNKFSSARGATLLPSTAASSVVGWDDPIPATMQFGPNHQHQQYILQQQHIMHLCQMQQQLLPCSQSHAIPGYFFGATGGVQHESKGARLAPSALLQPLPLVEAHDVFRGGILRDSGDDDTGALPPDSNSQDDVFGDGSVANLDI